MNSKILVILGVLVLVGGGIFVMTTTTPEDFDLDIDDLFERGEEFSGELESVLANSGEITSLKYEMVIDFQEMESVGTYWQKGDKMKMEASFEGGEDIVTYIDLEEGVAYSYMPAQEVITKSSFETEEGVYQGSIVDLADHILGHNPVVIGEETIDGKDCLVIEYVAEEQEVTAWIWKEYGLPIKTESVVGNDLIVSEVTNIEFDEIDDSVFELPEGVEIMEVPTM